MRKAVSLITMVWSFAMLYMARGFIPKEVTTFDSFSSEVLTGAFAWFGLIADASKDTIWKESMGQLPAIFVGISMLIGPFWGVIVIKDFGKWITGPIAILFSGFAASSVVCGHFGNIGLVIGGTLAPMAAALFLLGFSLNTAKNAAIKASGGETDDERRWRRERESHAESRRRRKSG